MLNINQFRQTRKLKAGETADLWTYGVHHDWVIEERYPQDGVSEFYVCGEQFNSLEEAELALHRMYSDDEMLYEDYH
ncbi:hypothetical protein [Salmonella phage SE4]|uniref:hypothetical protein n=1 Tax=Salmonella phage SE4 TaxID=2575328 RepID=UPI0011D2D7A2|nr:hypothetical protein HWC20_gp15 [Salmonella phage SE4]QEG07741.1 hypothetical protein [Salmonella phage SE4]